MQADGAQTPDDRAAIDDAVAVETADILREDAEPSGNRAAVDDAAAERRDLVDEYAAYPSGNFAGVDDAAAKGFQKNSGRSRAFGTNDLDTDCRRHAAGVDDSSAKCGDPLAEIGGAADSDADRAGLDGAAVADAARKGGDIQDENARSRNGNGAAVADALGECRDSVNENAIPLLEAPVIVPELMMPPENAVTPETYTSLPNPRPVWTIFPLLLMPPTKTDTSPTKTPVPLTPVALTEPLLTMPPRGSTVPKASTLKT